MRDFFETFGFLATAFCAWSAARASCDRFWGQGGEGDFLFLCESSMFGFAGFDVFVGRVLCCGGFLWRWWSFFVFAFEMVGGEIVHYTE